MREESERLGLTQEEMARLGGVKKRTYCYYEAGEREPSASFLKKLKEEADVDISYLLFGVHEFENLGITPSEKRLLGLYEKASDAEKKTIEALALRIVMPEVSETLLAVAQAERAAGQESAEAGIQSNGVERHALEPGPSADWRFVLVVLAEIVDALFAQRRLFDGEELARIVDGMVVSLKLKGISEREEIRREIAKLFL